MPFRFFGAGPGCTLYLPGPPRSGLARCGHMAACLERRLDAAYLVRRLRHARRPAGQRREWRPARGTLHVETAAWQRLTSSTHGPAIAHHSCSHRRSIRRVWSSAVAVAVWQPPQRRLGPGPASGSCSPSRSSATSPRSTTDSQAEDLRQLPADGAGDGPPRRHARRADRRRRRSSPAGCAGAKRRTTCSTTSLTFVTFPLVVGVAFHEITATPGSPTCDPAFYALVFGALHARRWRSTSR